MSTDAFIKDSPREDLSHHGSLKLRTDVSHKRDYDVAKESTDRRQIQNNDNTLTDSRFPGEEKFDGEFNKDQKNGSDFSEGGWGWVIVVASFFNSFIFDGIGSSYGVLYPYVHKEFQASAFVTSFAGSMFGSYLIMGSVSALLIKKFGFRAVSFAGGFMSCIAFVLASLSSNVYMFLLAYGVMGGASVGLVYLPSMVIVNGYFNKRRGVTNGIISSGAGMGLLVMAPLINALLDYYSLNGAVLILAGVLLNMCVFSCCFRQPRVYAQNASGGGSSGEQYSEAVCLLNNENNSDNNTEESTVDNSIECIQQSAGEEQSSVDEDMGELSLKMADKVVVPKQRQVANPDLMTPSGGDFLGPEANGGHLGTHIHSHNALFPGLKTVHSQSAGKLNVEKSSDLCWMRSLNLLHVKNDFDKLDHTQRKHPSQCSAVFADIRVGSYLTGSISHLVDVHNQHFASAHQLHTSRSRRSLLTISTNTVTVTNNGAHSSDVNVSAAKENGERLPQDMERFTESEATKKPDEVSCSLEIISESIGYSLKQLLRMTSFYLFCLGACLIQVGYPVPNIFLSDLAASHGIPPHQGALMISLIGSFNVGGRLLGGILANLSFNPIQLNDIAVFLAAVLCFLCPLFTNVWSLCLFSAMYGFLLGFFPPLQPLIIVKYFGIGSLASTFGFVTSLKGFAGLIGPPLAGWLYDATSDYSLSIVFAGVAFLLSVLVNETLVYITKRDSQWVKQS